MKTVIVAAKRTPIGTFLGAFADFSAVELGTVATKAVLGNLPLQDIADFIVGNVLQAGQGMNIARQIAIHAGLPYSVPAQTVNRVCGSGLQAVVSAVQGIKAGDGRLYLAGGVESMSRAPYLLKGARAGFRLGNGEVVDCMVGDGLTDAFGNYHMGVTAELVASRWGITRTDQDAFACESQRRAAAAIAAGHFSEEIVPVEVPARKGPPVIFAQDEHVRADTTAEALARLRPAFKPDGGTVTAGNASGINDGAAMTALASEEYAQAHGLPVMAEILGYSVFGVDPEVMGIAPVLAIPAALEHSGLSLADIDLFELSEAFAASMLAVIRDLHLDPAKVNVSGGAIAIGHPIGASGARLLVTLIHGLRRMKKELGVASLCIGGGMGIAMVVRAR